MKQLTAAFVALFFACSVSLGAESKPADVDAQIARFLNSIEFGVVMKQALAQSIREGNPNDPALGPLEKLPVERVSAIAAPLLKSGISLEDARKLAEFYASATMQAVIRSQNANGVDAPVVVTPAQKAEYDEFMTTTSGKAAVRMMEDTQKPAFQEQFLEKLGDELAK